MGQVKTVQLVYPLNSADFQNQRQRSKIVEQTQTNQYLSYQCFPFVFSVLVLVK